MGMVRSLIDIIGMNLSDEGNYMEFRADSILRRSALTQHFTLLTLINP